MFESRSEYDTGVNTFSPEGRLFQIEYAIEAVRIASTALGIVTADGVVLAAEKRLLSPLVEHASLNKIAAVDMHIGCVTAGLTADARILIDHARAHAQSHRFQYGEPVRTLSTTLSICDLALGFSEGSSARGKKKKAGFARPYGVSLLIGGVDDTGPALYHCEPSGTYYKYEYTAVGQGAEGAEATLKEGYNRSMSVADACNLAARVLKQVMKDAASSETVEMAVVRRTSAAFAPLTPSEIDAVLKAASDPVTAAAAAAK